jgi:hypothetical protein
MSPLESLGMRETSFGSFGLPNYWNGLIYCLEFKIGKGKGIFKDGFMDVMDGKLTFE